MYFMGKVEVCFEKFESSRRSFESLAGRDHEDIEFIKVAILKRKNSWREKFTKEMLAVYPEMKSYCLELEARIMELQEELGKERAINSIRTSENA